MQDITSSDAKMMLGSNELLYPAYVGPNRDAKAKTGFKRTNTRLYAHPKVLDFREEFRKRIRIRKQTFKKNLEGNRQEKKGRTEGKNTVRVSGISG